MQINNVDIQSAVEALKAGGLILFPSDICWEVVCDATNQSAVEKLYALTQQDISNVVILFDVPGRIPSYVRDVPEIAWDLIELSDKPLTLVLPNAKNLAQNLINKNGDASFRVVNGEFCNRLIQRFGKPIASLPASVLGKFCPQRFGKIVEEIQSGVDYCVPEIYFDPVSIKPSSIIAVGEGGSVKVIRE